MSVQTVQQGLPGADAYELAQSRDGFVGTYEEWRDANKGADGSPDTADQVAAKLGAATDATAIEAAKAVVGRSIEELHDAVGAMFQGTGHANADVEYDDTAGVINVKAKDKRDSQDRFAMVESAPVPVVNCIKFPGTGSGSYLQAEYLPTSVLSRGSDFTSMAWTRMDGQNSTVRHTIWEVARSGNDRVLIFQGGSSRYEAMVYSSGTRHIFSTSITGLADGNWHHVAFAYDSTNRENSKMYVDGVDRTVYSTDNATGGMHGATNTFNVGFNEGNNGLLASFFLDDMRNYAATLTQADIAELALIGRQTRWQKYGRSDYVNRYTFDRLQDRVDDMGDVEHLTYTSYNPSMQRRVSELSPSGYRNSFFINNSIGEDGYVRNLTPRSWAHSATGRDIYWNSQNPLGDGEANYTDPRSRFLGEALDNARFDMLGVQPYEFQRDSLTSPTPTSHTIDDDIDIIQTWIDKQPDLRLFVLHEGFGADVAYSSVATAEALRDAPLDLDNFKFSEATFDRYVSRLKAANPNLNIVRSRTMEALYLVAKDIEEGNGIPGMTIDGGGTYSEEASWYRDSQHINFSVGRCLIHNCIRASMGMCNVVYKEYPFRGRSTSLDVSDEQGEYIQTVIDRLAAKYW